MNYRADLTGVLQTVRVMIPPESAGWANLKSKAACCQAATNLVDRD